MNHTDSRAVEHAGLALAVMALLACSTPTAPTGDQTTRGGGSSGTSNSSGTGLRTTYCAPVDRLSNTQWATIPRLDGLDVRLYYDTLVQGAVVLWQNRYHDTIHFSYRVYRGGMNPPSTTERTSLRARQSETGSVGGGYEGQVSMGGQACVVVDQIRWGASDTGPYYNP